MLRSRASNRISRSRALSRASTKLKAKILVQARQASPMAKLHFKISHQSIIKSKFVTNRVPMASSLTTSCRAICECRFTTILLQTNVIRGPAWDMSLQTTLNLQWNWISRSNTLSVGRDSKINVIHSIIDAVGMGNINRSQLDS